MMSIKIFDPCVIPFLANLFGKYISLDQDVKLPYSVYTYNVFSNYAELGALCNHAMTQLLRIVGNSVWPNMEKSKFDNIKHLNIFAGLLLTKERINQLLISFYYWCQSITLNKSKSAPSDSQLLEVIFRCFSERFIVECQIKQQTCCRNESDNTNLTPTLYMVINKILDFKVLLEQENKKSAVVLFSERLRISKCIIDNLLKLGDNTSIIPIGFKLLLRVFYDNLETMNRFVLSQEPGMQKSKCVGWVECSQNIVNLIFPKNSLAFSLIMSNDMSMINRYWFHGWFNNNNNLVLDRSVAIANLQCWFFLSSKLGQRLDKDSFTSFSNDKSVVELTPFVEYMTAPIWFIMEFNDCVMIKNDYDEIWKTWEYLYVDVITKAAFLSDFSATFWLKSICPLLMNMFNKVTDHEKPIQNGNTIVFNMICRSLRLVVLRTDDDEEINKKHPFWKLLLNICRNFPIFSSNNLKLTFKELESNSVDDVGVLQDFPSTPVGKWAKLKLPFAAKFPCNLDSNFDTFLSLITVLIYKITHKKCWMLDILGILVPKMSSLSEALVGPKLQNDNLKTNTRNRHTYDENAVQLENFITYLIGRIGVCCLTDTITTDILEKLSPLLIYLFANEHGVLSRSTVSRVISFWNDEIGRVENLDYSPEMLKAIKKIKLSNKVIVIPDDIEEKIKDINISFELIRQDSSSLSEEPKILQYGSILNKEKRNSTDSKEVDRNLICVDENTSFTPIEDLSNKTPKEITPKKATPVKLQAKAKEFYSPAKEVVKRAGRKRTCFDLLRKSSDAEYVVIAPQKNKRIRLTDHQKESFNEQKNEYKPFINIDLDNVSKMNLLRNDSTISLASNDSLLNRINSIDESLVDKSPMEITDVSNIEKSLDNELSLDIVVNNPVDLPDMNSRELSVVLNPIVSINESTSTNIFLQEDKENLPEEKMDSQPLPPPLTKRLSVVLEKYPLLNLINIDQMSSMPPAERSEIKPAEEISTSLVEIISNNEKQQASQLPSQDPQLLANPSKVVVVVNNVTESPIFQRNAFTNYQSPLPIPRKNILIPANNNSCTSPMPNKLFKSRTQRAVQLAMENKIKNDSLPKPPVTSAPNTDVPSKPPGIIRHFWSERKNTRVSFSIPVANSENSPVTNNNESPIVNNSEEMFQSPVKTCSDNSKESNSASGFLSPIPVRMNKVNLPQISELTNELNKSLDEPQSLEKTRQSLKDIVDQFSPIKDHSESIVVQTVDHVNQALNIASAENQKEILRQLMAIIMSKM